MNEVKKMQMFNIVYTRKNFTFEKTEENIVIEDYLKQYIEKNPDSYRISPEFIHTFPMRELPPLCSELTKRLTKKLAELISSEFPDSEVRHLLLDSSLQLYRNNGGFVDYVSKQGKYYRINLIRK